MSEFDDARLLQRPPVLRREEPFAKKASTKIWSEKPSPDNPYITELNRCHGYELSELMEKRSFVDVLFLLFQGELPTPEQSELLEQLLIAFINPGPRHPATRAAMNAGVSKTDPAHILPISLTILGGEHLGASEVEQAIRWLRKNVKRNPVDVAAQLIEQTDLHQVGDIHIAPGFGSRFGGVEITMQRLAERFLTLPGAGKILCWGNELAYALNRHNMGWLSTGLIAAAFCDLGFKPRTGPGLFQIMCAPGLYAQGIEQASKALTDMPFPDDNDYIIEK